VWDEALIVDAKAEAAKEAAQWGEQVPGDPDEAAILASFNVQLFRKLKEEERKFINDTNCKHAIEISR
jgi:hypothetical protein